MKQLFENFRKYLLKENNIQHNHDFLKNDQSQKKSFFKKFFSWAAERARESDVAEQLVNNIPILRTYRIVSVLGGGMFGIAYKLNNDHVFKIFRDGAGTTGRDEVNKYRKWQDRQFAGKSVKNEPAIYDFGTTEVLFDGEKNEFSFVEMGRVIEFDQWVKSIGHETYWYDYFFDALDAFFMHYSPEFATFKNFSLFLKKKYQPQPNDEDWEISQKKETFENINKIDQRIQKILFASLAKFKKNGNTANDLHGGNLGVILARNHKEVPSFVFFDV